MLLILANNGTNRSCQLIRKILGLLPKRCRHLAGGGSAEQKLKPLNVREDTPLIGFQLPRLNSVLQLVSRHTHTA